MLDLDAAREQFADATGYFDTATIGLAPAGAIEAMQVALDEWRSGRVVGSRFDDDVARCRDAFGRLAGVGAESVAIVGQASVAAGMVAASLPDGAHVLCAEEDFLSVLFPFMADERLKVTTVPLHQVLDRIDDEVDMVAVSAVQSADGRVIDLDRLDALATTHDVRTYVDASHASGWLPLDAGRFDVTVSPAYKWLCCPRGVGFVTVGSDSEWLRPIYAGWYSADDPWVMPYGPPFRVASDARRFDASPAWFDYAASAPSLELLADVGVDAIFAHSVGLANRFREQIGLEPSNSAIVAIDTDRTVELEAVGIRSAARAGRARFAFYLYNTADDVDRAAAIVNG